MNKLISLLAASIWMISCNDSKTTGNNTASGSSDSSATTSSQLKEENLSYSANGVNMKGYLVYDQNKQGKRPGILVVPEWWGLNDYPKMRAKQLAELGYVAMAIDMYGEGQVAENPTDAKKLSDPFYTNPQMGKARFDAALAQLKANPQVDTANIAAIGYCFGGGIALNAAKMGSDLKGVVSFHGALAGVAPDKNLLKAKILVCHGGDDKFVSAQDVANFKKQMDSVGADYTFKVYPNATHAFTNPKATETGKKFSMPIAYNPDADKNSWNDMKDFFGKLFH